MIEFPFILGNGVTRLEVVPEELLQRGQVYGCNRIYEEFEPTVLVSTDRGMAEEIQLSGYSKRRQHYTRKQNVIEHSGARILPQQIHDFSSGPAACGLACYTDAEYIFLIGFDLKGQHNFINNIYAGTKNYKSKDSAPTYWSNWETQISTLLTKFPSKNIVHVNPLHEFTSLSWLKHTNFRTMYLDEFKLVINNT
jgi:hypothetical protein